MSGYAHPEMLVSTQWASDHLNDLEVRCVEVGFNSTGYDTGHIIGTVFWACNGDILKPGSRDLVDKEAVEALLSRSGIGNKTKIVLYDSHSNLLAAMTLWMLKIYGHQDVCLLDGGRRKWTDEGHPLTTDAPAIQPTTYKAKKPDWTLRAHRDLVLEGIDRPNRVLVDARTVAMYTGEDARGAAIGGHISGAINVPAAAQEMDNGKYRWRTPTTNEDGTFKSADELHTLFSSKGITSDKEIITYCTRGGLSSHMWFVLKYLLGYPEVREYDGSWTEWGNLVGVPIERGTS
jgi:thiosulfate/3-mercaptopyruvate sulfurtransferase